MSDTIKIMIKQFYKFIRDDRNLVLQYKNDGYEIEWDLYKAILTVTYKNKKYVITITKINNHFYWHLSPYNNSYFETKIDRTKCNLDYVFLAIKENEEFFNKKGE